MDLGYDVVVVGGGHAGTEAAAASARVGARTALVTHRRDTIGVMSCNPAIGGLGKGHLVREIDALDGLMAQAADQAGIQFRILNASKGAAVRGPRAQADRRLYRNAIQRLLAAQPGLDIVEGAATGLWLDAGVVAGVTLEDGRAVRAAAVVITAGTFLDGRIHLGARSWPAGRWGEAPAQSLSSSLRALGHRVARLKTGTPPRLDGRTIDFAALEVQPGDDPPVPFSSLSEAIATPQVPCHITWTSPEIHDLIRSNLALSPLYNGQIAARGPRYCPSIEDKVVRFADKSRHQVFLEPEGLDDPTVYPNGISTSLDEALQREIVQRLPGCHGARVLQPGYAIEYDYFDPRGLHPSLESRFCRALFLAGQINGTTGYEEAAAQGLLAGVNAARRAGGLDCVQESRTSSYLGVLLDDLTTAGVSEPYRMFTSRAEFRLHLRADNADQRLTPRGIYWGCVGSTRRSQFDRWTQALDRARALLDEAAASPSVLRRAGLVVKEDGQRRSALQLLGAGVSRAQLQDLWPQLRALAPAVLDQLEIEASYAGYLERQAKDVADMQRDEALRIPEDLDYRGIGSLSTEMRERLTASRPPSIGAAARVPGVTPAAVLAILHHVRHRARPLSPSDPVASSA